MDTATVRARLTAEGVRVIVHRDGSLSARLTKRAGEYWAGWLKSRVKAIPGAVVLLTRERPAGDPYFEHSEVLFHLGTRPEFFHSVTAQQLRTEDHADEVGIGDGAVIPARFVNSPGKRPDSIEGPGRVSPGAMVGFGSRSAA